MIQSDDGIDAVRQRAPRAIARGEIADRQRDREHQPRAHVIAIDERAEHRRLAGWSTARCRRTAAASRSASRSPAARSIRPPQQTARTIGPDAAARARVTRRPERADHHRRRWRSRAASARIERQRPVPRHRRRRAAACSRPSTLPATPTRARLPAAARAAERAGQAQDEQRVEQSRRVGEKMRGRRRIAAATIASAAGGSVQA